MKLHSRFIIPWALAASLALAGCGNKPGTSKMSDEQRNKEAAEGTRALPPTAATPQAGVPAPPPPPSLTPPPPTAAKAPPAAGGDPLAGLREVDETTGKAKGDLETLQRVVDAYAFGRDGLGAPPLKDLSELVAKGYLKQLPAPPPGKKWAYDSQKWKVSLVNQ